MLYTFQYSDGIHNVCANVSRNAEYTRACDSVYIYIYVSIYLFSFIYQPDVAMVMALKLRVEEEENGEKGWQFHFSHPLKGKGEKNK